MRRVFLGFLLFIGISCNTQINEIYKIDPADFGTNPISLQDIADDIQYIPLDNKIPFTNFKYIISRNSIYVSARDTGILEFDRNGMLIRTIGSRGRGPGEYRLGMNFTVDEIAGKVYVLDYRTILVYSREGTYLRDISFEGLAGNSGMPGEIVFYNSFLFLPDYNINGNSKLNWSLLDTLGNLISIKRNSVPPFVTNVGMDGSLYIYGSHLYYYNLYNDTIFSISPDLTFKAAYIFTPGNHRWPKTKIDISQTKNHYSFFRPLNMFETKKYIVFRYYSGDNSAIAFIDKETKKTSIALKTEKAGSGINSYRSYLRNDLDGGPAFSGWIQFYEENGREYLTNLINPLDIKNLIINDEFSDSKVNDPEKKKEFEELANRISETDNPILMIVKLRD
jgi:hypothetical protein